MKTKSFPKKTGWYKVAYKPGGQHRLWVLADWVDGKWCVWEIGYSSYHTPDSFFDWDGPHEKPRLDK